MWKERSPLCSTKNPGPKAAGKPASSDDRPGTGCPMVRRSPGAGGGAGAAVRISAAAAQKTHRPGRPAVFGSFGLRMAVSELCRVPGRYPPGLHTGPVFGHLRLRPHPGETASACFFRFLEGCGGYFAFSYLPREKNFSKNARNYENFICIFEKMGYNKME